MKMMVMNKSYKEVFIEQHGKAMYLEKLAKNAEYQVKNAEVLAEKRRKKSSKQEDTILLIGDTHIGSSTVDPDFMKQLAKEYWSKNPIIFLGDACDFGLEKGYNWDNKQGPQEQIEIFTEIAKSLNVIAYCIGNHGHRIFVKTGLNPFISIFGMEPSNTLEYNGRVIYFNHGRSAAQDCFNEHQRYIKWVDSDVIALGHSHALATMCFLRGKKLQHLVRTGGFIWHAQYAIDAGFNPLLRGWAQYNTNRNTIRLKALTDEGEVFAL